MNEYEISVNFNGYVGSDVTYTVDADSYEEALDLAVEQAKDDLDVLDVVEADEGLYDVTVGFAGMIGVEETYAVYADDEDEAADVAIDEAADDLIAE